jgi:hypothetical protein
LKKISYFRDSKKTTIKLKMNPSPIFISFRA